MVKGGGEASEPRKEETATASPAPEAAPRPAQVHAALLILQLGGESRQDVATSLWGPGDIPHLLFSAFVNRPRSQPCLRLPGHPWPAGGRGRWDTAPLWS